MADPRHAHLEERARRFTDAFNRDDLDGVMALVAVPLRAAHEEDA